MPVNGAEQGVVIHLGPCRCSGRSQTLHPEGDTVTLRPSAGLQMALAATSALRQAGRAPGDIQAALGWVYLRYGITAWTFEDDGPVPVTPENIETWLPWDKGGSDVADRADELYSGTVLGPLLRRSAAPPPTTQETGSTSPTPPSGDSSPTSRRPSSRSRRAAGPSSNATGA